MITRLLFTAIYFLAALPGDATISVTEAELYQKCKLAYTEGKFTDASQYIKKFLSLYPASGHIAEMLFMQAFTQPVISFSIETYQSIIEKYPNSKWAAKSHFQLGQCYYLQRKYDKALDHYGKIIVSYPEDETYWPARYWKCESLIAMGKYEEAISALRSLQGSNPAEISRDMILMSLSKCYSGMKDYERAAASYRSLIESMPDSQRVPSACFLLAKSLQNLSRLEEAKVIYQKVTETYPQSLEAQQAKQNLDSLKLTQPTVRTGLKLAPTPRNEEKAAAKTSPTHEEKRAVSDTATGATHVSPTKSVFVAEALSSCFSTPKSYFSVQVGAFSDKSNAENLANQLRKKGHVVNIISPSPGKSTLYKVRVGEFKTRDAASKAAQELSKNEKLPVDVVYQ